MDFEYSITPVEKDTWRLDEGLGGNRTYAHLLAGTRRALLVDAGQGLGNLRAAAERLTPLPLFVVNTHGHLDHVGSDYQFDEVYLHPADEAVLAEHTSPAYRLPMFTAFAQELNWPMDEAGLQALASLPAPAKTLPLQDGQLFDLGGRTLEVITTPGHTPGSVCLLEAARGQLFTGDTVCAQGVLLHLPHSSSVATFHASIRCLLARLGEFNTIHPGHHDAPLGTAILHEYLACAEGILDGSIRGIPAANAGQPGLMGLYGSIGLAYREDNIQ